MTNSTSKPIAVASVDPVPFGRQVAAQSLRDFRVAARAGGDWFHAVFFFTIFIGLTGFAVGPERAALAAAAPALIWLGATMALLLAASALFASDLEDGTLNALVTEQESLAPYVTAKGLSMAILSVGPILGLSPFFYIALALAPDSALIASVIFLVGAPAFVFAALFAGAVAAGLRMSGLLSAGIAAPLIVPILIFGVAGT